MLNKIIRWSRPVWYLIKGEWVINRCVLLIALIRRFIVGYMLAQLICWLGLGYVLLAQLLFNPEQFAKDYASLTLVREAVYRTVDVINDANGWIGILSGLGFMAILTVGWAIDRLRYSIRMGWTWK